VVQLSERFVMTNAPCVERDPLKPTEFLKPQKLKVLAGSLEKEPTNPPIRADVRAIYVHPKYGKAFRDDYDFALLELSQPMDISEKSKARAACLPDANIAARFDNNTKFVASGWGDKGYSKTDSGPGQQILTEVLQDVEVRKASFEDCYDWFTTKSPSNLKPINITKTAICTMAEGHKIGNCLGDAGGPLTWMDPQDSLFKLVGVASFASMHAHGEPGQEQYLECVGPYAGYARVSSALDWIQDIFDGNVEPNPTTAEK